MPPNPLMPQLPPKPSSHPPKNLPYPHSSTQPPTLSSTFLSFRLNGRNHQRNRASSSRMARGSGVEFNTSERRRRALARPVRERSVGCDGQVPWDGGEDLMSRE